MSDSPPVDVRDRPLVFGLFWIAGSPSRRFKSALQATSPHWTWVTMGLPQTWAVDNHLGIDLLVLELPAAALTAHLMVKAVRKRRPQLPVLCFDRGGGANSVLYAMQCHANGFLYTGSMRRHLEPAVHSLMQGGVFLCPEAQAQLFAAFGRNLIMEPSKKLTERETQLVTWLIQGASHKQIAREMGIAPATVHVHLCNVYGKTGTHSRQELLQKLCGDGEPV